MQLYVDNKTDSPCSSEANFRRPLATPLGTVGTSFRSLLFPIEILLSLLASGHIPSLVVSSLFRSPLRALDDLLVVFHDIVAIRIDSIDLYILVITILALCTLRACTDGNVDCRRYAEAVCFRYLCKIKVVDVKDALERIGGISLDIRAEAIFCRLMQVVVLSNELFEL